MVVSVIWMAEQACGGAASGIKFYCGTKRQIGGNHYSYQDHTEQAKRITIHTSLNRALDKDSLDIYDHSPLPLPF
jgi:hypothetical protein